MSQTRWSGIHHYTLQQGMNSKKEQRGDVRGEEEEEEEEEAGEWKDVGKVMGGVWRV